MREHGYHLQARLYLLALHRYLKLRLPAYDPAQHLGGACYLFVRGMRPDWRSPDGTQTGISLLAPKVELILEMERRMTG
jgi:exodeoxyribonuclease V beta subunit